MRSIDANIVNQLKAGQLKPFILLEIAATYYYTDCQVPIGLNSNLYQPRAFSIGGIRYSTGRVVDEASVELDNLDEELSTFFIGGTPQGEDVTISLVVLDSNNAVVAGDCTALFYGEIDRWSAKEDVIEFSIVNKYSRWPRKKAARHPSSCRWREFKDADCQYAGSDTECDRTYTTCTAKGNQANFGGFRWLPSIEGKEVWWGKVPG